MQVIDDTNPAELDFTLSLQLSPSVKGTIIIGMCEGLLHLHSKDIVHQDLKPENIMVSGDYTHSVYLCAVILQENISYRQNHIFPLGGT